ncbi:MAG: hypothetical protein CBC39_01305 [Cellvibrionales bacterium TMED79]|jgi:hypothetical protein|nr:hypothetical protein [Halieaceae bacterium]OUV05447.1 MAG: hypothetical protein CBC39_01305 [Cellvibrionales bacterium TMED79]
MRKKPLLILLAAMLTTSAQANEKQIYWGDTHLHTNRSFDAFTNRNFSVGPDEAYRFARGLPVEHPGHKARVQLETPLDFLVVSDHAEFLGAVRHVYNEGLPTNGLGWVQKIKLWYSQYLIRDAIKTGNGREFFYSQLPDPFDTPQEAVAEWEKNIGTSVFPKMPVIEDKAWSDIADAAEANNRPGEFSAILGWEYSLIPGGANLHRVVMTDLDGESVKVFQPFGSDDSMYPEDLWAWLDETSQQTGGNFIAIPHNSNISKGAMFDTITMRNEPVGPAYAKIRKRWEPIVEITQYKGDSETHPSLSPEDPFADFEDYPFYIQKGWTQYKPEKGDFIRSALLRGMQLEQEIGINPYQFGVIGSTDAHTGLAAAEENNFHGKFATDSTPEMKLYKWSDNANSSFGWAMGAQGLAAVWAEENTREGILAAMKRRETYATTGSRIGLRFYGGFGIDESLLQVTKLSADGVTLVPMGGELNAVDARPPTFIVHAMADPKSGALDRIQIVKGWINPQGEALEKVFDVAWSSDDRLNPDGSLSPVPNTVNLETGAWSNEAGAASLSTAWQDPEFDPAIQAFYYVRVLEVPTPRHSLLDKIALGGDVDTSRPDVIQERAYSSAIWYQPAR